MFNETKSFCLNFSMTKERLIKISNILFETASKDFKKYINLFLPIFIITSNNATQSYTGIKELNKNIVQNFEYDSIGIILNVINRISTKELLNIHISIFQNKKAQISVSSIDRIQANDYLDNICSKIKDIDNE
jgi:hypothetical protein